VVCDRPALYVGRTLVNVRLLTSVVSVC